MLPLGQACVTSLRAWTRQRLASSILKPFWLCGLASRSAASAACAESGVVRRSARQRRFGLGRSPGLGADAAERDAGMRDLSVRRP